MEAADHDFTRGMQYLFAARRLEEWASDDVTDSKLRKLAIVYRVRANGLMMGLEDGDQGVTALHAHGRRGSNARAQ